MNEEYNTSPLVNGISKNKQAELDKDVDNILDEFPIETPKVNLVNKQMPTKKTKKKFKLFGKKLKVEVPKESPEQTKPFEFKPKPKKQNFGGTFWPVLVIMVLLLGIAVWITMSCNCEVPVTDVNAITEATNNLISSMQNQIIAQGYAEVVSDGITLKLAPYTG